MFGNVIAEVPRYLCCQCGICEAVCPRQRIVLTRDKIGNYWPTGPAECKDCNSLCTSVCPGRAIFTPDKSSGLEDSASYHEFVGQYLGIYVVRASDRAIQYHASSGGAVTALLQYLLESGQTEGAIVTKLDETSPFEPKTFIAKSSREIMEARGSKYIPVPACRAVKEILQDKENKDKKYVFVGVPCQIGGVLHARRRIPRLQKQIPLTFSLFCGRNATLELSRYALKQHGIDIEDVRHIRFRSHGWPGKMTVVSKDGQTHVLSRRSFLLPWTNNFFTPDRCTTCPDVIGENADLCFGDAWLPELSDDRAGLSVVIAKSKRSAEILTEARRLGYIDIIDELPIDRLIFSQIGQFKKKKSGVRIVYFSESLRGRKTPLLNGKLPAQKLEAMIYTFLLYLNNNISKIPFFFPVYMKVPMKFWDIISRPFRKNVVRE